MCSSDLVYRLALKGFGRLPFKLQMKTVVPLWMGGAQINACQTRRNHHLGHWAGAAKRDIQGGAMAVHVRQPDDCSEFLVLRALWYQVEICIDKLGVACPFCGSLRHTQIALNAGRDAHLGTHAKIEFERDLHGALWIIGCHTQRRDGRAFVALQAPA